MSRSVVDPRQLGTVEDVRGGTVGVVLAAKSGLVFNDGEAYHVGQVGGFVRIQLGLQSLFGIVSQVGASAIPSPAANLDTSKDTEDTGERCWMTVELVGESDSSGQFRRGLSQYPAVGDRVFVVTERDLRLIYGSVSSPSLVSVGHLASAASIPALLDVDKLVTRHSAIVGSTGAGKSTTVAGLLRALTDQVRYPSARVLVFDIHGEYAHALGDRATVFRVGEDEAGHDEVRPLFVPYWALTFDELVAVSMPQLADEKARGSAIEVITRMKREALLSHPRAGVSADVVTVDSPVPFSIHKFYYDTYCEMRATYYSTKKDSVVETVANWALEANDNKELMSGNVMLAIPPVFKRARDVSGDDTKIRLSQSKLSIGNAIDALGSKLRDPRYNFIFRPGPWLPDEAGFPKEDADTLLDAWLGQPKPITIFDLSGVPVTILKDLVGALLRIVYDSLFWARNLSEGGRERPLLVVLEEAHSYLGSSDTGPAAIAVRRIAKEGRKYGIGAMLVSQRPAEVDTTILSQCGTVLAMRLSNTADRAHVKSIATDNLASLFDMLPVLRTGELLLVGEAVRLPVRAVIEPPPADWRPDSSDPRIVGWPGSPGGWDKTRSCEKYEEVLQRWRGQNPRYSPSTKKGDATNE
jgi:DNA helicase HerA-like ATPase